MSVCCSECNQPPSLLVMLMLKLFRRTLNDCDWTEFISPLTWHGCHHRGCQDFAGIMLLQTYWQIYMQTYQHTHLLNLNYSCGLMHFLSDGRFEMWTNINALYTYDIRFASNRHIRLPICNPQNNNSSFKDKDTHLSFLNKQPNKHLPRRCHVNCS